MAVTKNYLVRSLADFKGPVMAEQPEKTFDQPPVDERKMNIFFGIRSPRCTYNYTQSCIRSDVTEDIHMKKTFLALTATALLVTGFSASAMADSRYYYRDDSPVYFDNRDDDDAYQVQDRRYYDGYRDDRRYRFGSRDVARMLERRGFRVRDVSFDRGRYFARTLRRGEPVLVVVSRDGDILETRRMGGDRYRDRRQNGFSIEINPAY